MKGMYDANREIFLDLMTAVEDDMTKNCLKKDSDLMEESLHQATELFTTGIRYRHNVLIAVQ